MSGRKNGDKNHMPAPNGQCLRCGAKCCNYFALPLDEPEDKKDFDDIRWFLLHEGVSVFVEDGDWYILIERRCKALTTDNLCEVYDSRPRICRKYKDEECEFAVPDGEYELLLRTPEECMAYAAKVLGKKGGKKHAKKGKGKKT